MLSRPFVHMLLVAASSAWRPAAPPSVASCAWRPAVSRPSWLSMSADTATDSSFATLDAAKAAARKARAASGMVPKKRKGKSKPERYAPVSEKGFGAGSGLKYSKKPKGYKACACDLGHKYESCCGPEHASGAVTSDPTSLLRARYSAFCYRDPDFLIGTTHPGGAEWREDQAAWKKELLSFTDRFNFEGLRVLEAATVDEEAGTAQIRFGVSLVEKGSIKMMDTIEDARFVRDEHGRWLYSSGDVSYETPS